MLFGTPETSLTGAFVNTSAFLVPWIAQAWMAAAMPARRIIPATHGSARCQNGVFRRPGLVPLLATLLILPEG